MEDLGFEPRLVWLSLCTALKNLGSSGAVFSFWSQKVVHNRTFPFG